jgi:phospho-N-acetylmuramoyl-pentapeptide-transferase
MLLWLFGDVFKDGITLRAALAGILAFGASVMLGPRVIRWLRSRKVGERTEKGDSRHLDEIMHDKKGTPTMGGVFVVAAILMSAGLFGNFSNPVMWILFLLVGALGALGAVDDYLKLSGRSRTGMRMSTKLVLQVAAAAAAGAALQAALLWTERDPGLSSRLYVPFIGGLDLGVGYWMFVLVVIVSTTNAVNITDGLDGLAGGCLGISTFAYAVIAYLVGRVDFSAYLGLPYVKTSAEITVFCTAMLGATLGFLWFNSHPAQVFLGDSGSLPLGGALGLVACATKQEVLLLLVGGVFVIEAFSSLLQIVSYKATGRRVFLIAPLHHHFQFRGLPESKITMRFWILAAVMAVASLALLKLR